MHLKWDGLQYHLYSESYYFQETAYLKENDNFLKMQNVCSQLTISLMSPPAFFLKKISL